MRSILPFFRKGFGGLFAFALLAMPVLRTEAQVTTRSYAVEVSAIVKSSPPEIALSWPADVNATGYTVHRKTLNGSSWTPMATLGASATSWTDQSVAVGGAYEYAINRSTSAGFTGTGYIYAGIEAPMTESRGKLVFLVDNTHSTALATELARMQQDFVGDGWTVIRHDVARTATPVQVKNLILAAYNADPANVKSVFIFGHVAVPYSGNFRPDGHPDHQGAWAADAYYADVNGLWTDATVNNTSGGKTWTHNVPGDGKFDQSELPSDVELQVGRVDLHNMTCYANKTPARSELDLLRAYTEKHHKFRHGQLVVERRGLVCDNFGTIYGEAFASTGWRSFAPMFGAQNNHQVGGGYYFTALKDHGYLWSYGTGGGSYYTCNGVGSSDDFAITPIKSVFTSYLGSYFGDWDNESNFMRASLGSGWVLATAWGGRPHWWFHHMGLGEPIGLSAKVSQNNRYGGVYGQANTGTRGVHAALLGDPTLRLHPVIPPGAVSAISGSGVTVSWTASADQNIRGYAVYRAATANGPFTRVSGASLLPGTSFSDASGTAGQVYMVRAVKLETSGSGTYHNPSQGVFATAAAVNAPAPTPTPTPAPAPTASASYLGEDRATSGAWKGAYGSDGYVVAQMLTNLPSYATVTTSAALPWVWETSTIDPSALEKVPGPGRMAACWYTTTEMSISVNLKDGQTHRVSLYCNDLTRSGRQQTIDVIDAQGRILSSRTLSDMSGGVYLSWNITGAVTFRVRALALPSVVSAVFFGSTGVNSNPTTPTTSGTKVRHLGANTSTQGAWKGVFGSQGFQVAAEGVNLPSWARVMPSGKSDHVWNWSTTQSAALQKAGAPDRLAACWYATSGFDVRVNIADGQAHKVSFYALDWDGRGRNQRVDVIDSATGALLHSTTVSSFQTGKYLSYDVKGDVTFRFVNSGGDNAVVSGWFIDPASAAL